MKQKDILILLIPTFIIVVAWIIFHVYHSTVTSTIPEALNIQIAPINPNFDTKTIEKLKSRKTIVPLFKTQAISTASLKPSLSPSPKPSIPVTKTQGSSGAIPTIKKP